MAPFQIRFGFHSSHESSEEEEEGCHEEELEGEEEEEQYEEEEVPISSPLIYPSLVAREEEKEGSNQFSVLEMVVAALRKSLVMCSVGSELEEEGRGCLPRAPMDIGWPTDVQHVAHVTFDRFDGFLGLPVELEPEVPRQAPSASVSVFGVSPNSMQCSFDKRGNSIPTILLSMQRHLYQHGGLQAEGIFRINADNSQEVYVREHLNRGVVPEGVDLHCLAGLIKAWFRELPSGVLDSLTPEQVMHCNTEEECSQLARMLPATQLALLDWAINLMADIVENEHHNKMNARNIAMVFAPNMTQMADPLTALIHAVQVMNFLKTLILKTIREREEALKASGIQQSCSESPSDRDEPNSNTSKPTYIEKNADYPIIDQAAFDQLILSAGPICKCEVNGDHECIGSEHGSFNSSTGDGLMDRFSFRKGVSKLCRHPVFQLSRSMKKAGELGVVDSSENRQAWV
ncbi:Rho GTPase-activating protein 3 [Rhynchospora pubera]|uniref:Rho GTPase-activating protein 3 n=1 Tax=Rhynchospora pubera TaxID=906938 RepID=A0AAV8CTP1_9POAL|nr:Rho GTPase-activating protein 3 [Rhynchospora pubera]